MLFCMLALSAVCGILIPKVNVNSDMTRYLPDDSQMKQGLDIVTAEFGGTQMTGPAVRLMFRDVASSRVQGITDTLSSFSQVKAVSHSFSEDGQYVLFELNVPNSVDQKLLGQEISSRFEDDIVVETSQDGNTPPASVMIIAAALILIILVAMAQSWLEPLIFLISTGLAVVMNIGTNALLPSVSITTNYIVAILQMVLSLDYSIVLMNRYRQEKTGENSPVEAVNRAIKRAFPSIMSSAATTVVGLVMLVFMRLKIGMDMGVVLAKGVIFSLVCTFTVLPSLLMIFQKGVMNTGKKTFVLPTNRISRMVTRYKIPLACAAIVLFFFAFFQSKKTDISFSMERESEINSVFPQHNPFVVVYPTAAESSVPALADSLLKDGAVEGVYAYPTVMRRQYTSSEMAGQIQTMAAGFKEELPKELDSSMFTASMMSLVYHMKFEDDPSRQIPFPELLGFIREHCVGNPMFDSVLDDDMREKLALLDMYAPAVEEEENVAETGVGEAPAPKASAPKAPAPKATAPDTPKPAAETAPEAKPQTSVRLSAFLPRLAEAYPSTETAVLASLSDRTMNNTPMAAPAMSEFIGSTPTQTRMVYSFSKNKSKQMTPYEYVHFLYDDLFNRKALASFVSEDQKEGLRQRMNVMDLIQKDASLEFSELYSLLRDFGAASAGEARLRTLAFPSSGSTVPEVPSAVSRPDSTSGTLVAELPQQKDSLASSAGNAVSGTVTAADSSALNAQLLPNPLPKPVKPKKKSIEEQRQDLFMDLMYSGRSYTARQMAGFFKRLGEPVGEDLISLLYVYYASVSEEDCHHTMNIEELVNFIGDDLLNDKRLSGYIDDEVRSHFNGFRKAFEEKISLLRREDHSLMLVLTKLPPESRETYDFVSRLSSVCDDCFGGESQLVGESVMYSEMKNGFGREMRLVTILTVLAIFLIVAVSFRSVIVPLILVMTVMTAVYVNVIFSGIFSGTMLYLAYLIVQSILMGATIDYGILYANYYKEYRKTMDINDAITAAYRGFIRTIMTSGLIMVVAPGAMALLVDDVAISAIVGSLSIGAMVSVVLILLVVPAVLGAFDSLVVRKKDRFKK